ncbi:hypothetical protein LI142_13715 [Eubacterium limosum]|uniref:SMODS-associated NUDIX domain-containing protein n=1 Tax=Eubacterium limosum TaxID=1736 RepID=UPI001D062AE4|nr:hypothetical protein [Eubacterium limosum]MCB6570557.1 hypothetical protein [Eubacterium limosum]
MLEFLKNHLFDSIFDYIIVAALTWIITDWKRIFTRLQALIHWKTDYRVSLAYLFRIKIDNKYLLIKGNRIEQFQPVGGVYKYHESFKDTYDTLGLRPENNSSFYEENDLRLFVKGKNLNKLLSWFESKKNREVTVIREFKEELIDSHIFDEDLLKKTDFEFLKQINKGIHYSTHFHCKEVLIFDIYDVLFQNDSVKDLITTGANRCDSIILAGSEDINRECIDICGKSFKIGAHAKYIE